MPTDSSRLVGVWRLQSFYLENSLTQKKLHPYGDNPRGFLVFLQNGRMIAVITPTDRTAPVTEQDQAAAFNMLIAYSGRFRLEEPDQWVTLVDVAWFEPWVGTEQRRIYRFRGDDQLEVTSAPVVMPAFGDTPMVGVLSWLRD